jgi:hypothetical protein
MHVAPAYVQWHRALGVNEVFFVHHEHSYKWNWYMMENTEKCYGEGSMSVETERDFHVTFR